MREDGGRVILVFSFGQGGEMSVLLLNGWCKGSNSARVRGLISSWPLRVWITCFRKIILTCWWLLSLSSAAAGVEGNSEVFWFHFSLLWSVIFMSIILLYHSYKWRWFYFILGNTLYLSQQFSSTVLNPFIAILTQNLVTHHNVAAPTKELHKHRYKTVTFWNANRARCGIWNDDKYGIKDQFASPQPTLKQPQQQIASAKHKILWEDKGLNIAFIDFFFYATGGKTQHNRTSYHQLMNTILIFTLLLAHIWR